MKTSIIDNELQIVAETGEELIIFRNTVYRGRIVVFKTIEPGLVQEIQFDRSTGRILDRAARSITLPEFEYIFDQYKIVGIAAHRFLDELDFNGFKPKGIDIETITVRLFNSGQEINTAYHMHPVNQSTTDYYEQVKRSVDRYVETEKATKEQLTFLQTTYSKWDSEEKANYQYRQILLQDKMQGGYPSNYKNPAATYLSKWFIDRFQAYDDNIFYTLELIAKKFLINNIYLTDMIKYDPASENWQKLAKELDLMA